MDRFKARRDYSLRAPITVKEGEVEERGTLFLDKKFKTKSGKIELWTKELAEDFLAYGLSAIPHYYTDPDIASSGEPTISYDKSSLIPSPFHGNKTYTYKVRLVASRRKRLNCYPFYLVSGRPCSAIMGHISHWIKRLNDLAPNQVCVIHKKAAEGLGIKDGDLVKVRSLFGETQALALLSSGIRQDTVFIPYSYGQKSPFTPWKSVNYVTNLGARCPISGQVAFRGVRVVISRARAPKSLRGQ